MDNIELRRLAEEIGKVINQHDVEFTMFAINITVTKEYFDAVKDNLHSNIPVPSSQMFTEVDEKWAINLIRPMQIGNEEND